MVRELAQPLLFVLLPNLLVALAYGGWLGHRTDYLGHYLAGCGGTAGAISVLLSIVPRSLYLVWKPLIVLSTTIACIAAGGVLEATIFNLAQFDGIDFCNQSLGAVVAAVGTSAAWTRARPEFPAVVVAVLIAGGLVWTGFYFAFL